MDLTQINPVVIVLALACLCVVGIILLTVLNLIGGVLDLISGAFGLVFNVASVDPSGGCGCLVVLLLCAGVGCVAVFGSSLLSTCGTPDAVRFCTWIGR